MEGVRDRVPTGRYQMHVDSLDRHSYLTSADLISSAAQEIDQECSQGTRGDGSQSTGPESNLEA